MHSDIFTALTINLLNHWYADAAWQYNTDTGITEKGNVSTRYNPEPGKVLNMAYRYTRNSLEQIDVSSEWPLGGNWYGLGRLNYSLRDHPPTDKRGPAEYLAGVEYNAGCWIGRAVLHRLATTSTQANYAFFFQLELGGLSSIGTNPLDVLKRSISGYTSSDMIPGATR
jgi:LPS-assembly protein